MHNGEYMKIVIIGPRYHTNQVCMVRIFKERGHNVYFHTLLKGATEDYSLIEPLVLEESAISRIIGRLIPRKGRNKPKAFPSIIKYFFHLLKLKPDIFIIREPDRYFSKLAAILALLMRARIVFYSQEELYQHRKWKTRLKKSLNIALFRASWMTPIIGKIENNNKPINHMYYVPLPVSISDNNIRNNSSIDGRIRLLFIGKFHQIRKKHILLLEALSYLKDKYNFELTMIGECVTEPQKIRSKIIENYIIAKGLKDIVKLKMNIPYSGMSNYYASSDIFVLPAVDEPYAISVSEALGYGLPVICTDTCGARFHIKNGVNGFVIESNSLNSLVGALE